ncbi:PhzF family phenazine biosynthesis protein [Aureimonas leprariae]|uniref:PhzF family phenazine biosynthesis protein n=1 Tax=Plantimonas leprariae TaxID=2615207 RepID=A0A7V7PLE6_9HYPH|nr:PhzF family phenazine biosynthesis protein [Aureimonas leprariae]KAB0677175.1 PhzF family phenazine biosynthesis protein [Aureimonas leprariae]
MQRRFRTVDVFTRTRFGGNPLAVVLDAEGLSTDAMQAIAREFNYSETSFVLSPKDAANTAEVRIFTPDRELPFAGHPNVGTAFVLADEARRRGEAVPERFAFEERAGLVRIGVLTEAGAAVGGEIAAPEALSRRGTVSAEKVAACLSLDPADIATERHAPEVVSVGLPFLVAELRSREALRRIRPTPASYDDALPAEGAHSLYVYTRDAGAEGTDIQARMFNRQLTAEDPATGSATAAAAALLAELDGAAGEVRRLFGQGFDMGHPSLLETRAERTAGGIRAFVGGRCVSVFEGTFEL